MNWTLLAEPAAPNLAVTAHGVDALLLPPWDALDDAALLAHFRSPRAVQFEPVSILRKSTPSALRA